MNRKSVIKRDTNETKVAVKLNIDGTGERKLDTPVGFKPHVGSFCKRWFV